MSQRDQPNPPPVETLSPLKRAFIALEQAQARIATLEQAAREPIAIIGLGCRVPGADDPAAFWQLMKEARDVVGPIPSGRWDVDAHYDPDPSTPGRIATRSGGFLRTVDEFDPEVFGIAPREAQGMDPQQRLFLEVAWEALEHAGQAPDRLERSKTGVYVGVCNSDYTHLQLKTEDPHLLDAHFTSGIAHSIASGRVSYLLGLQGPSLTIDTACSSSLVAVHLACQALRSGDCRMALAGGVNLILSAEMYIALSHSRMLAPDGRCKTFSASADGFGRGEGCGVVVLKRLSDAQADGDTILAVIRGTAVNQDGPSGGLTAPNGPAQEAVIREALARSGIAPRDVGLVEAHGTGTELGDPLEVQALGSVFAERDSNEPLIIGSVKTNIGHLESAAGITGLIKVVLALRHRHVPAHLHFETPSPHIPWADLPVRVPTKLTPWEPIRGRRIGGVSSFGFSGTNAHVVLEEAPELPRQPAVKPSTHLFTLSAFDEKSLAELAARHAAALEGRSDEELADICFTANTGRARFAQRAVIVASSIAELRDRLASLASGTRASGVEVGRARSRDPLKIAFVFTGQGAQYARMAQALYARSPVFRAALDRCAELVAPHLDEPLLDVIFSDATPSPVDQTAYTQPALFAVEYALAELWRSWGVTPNAVIGHSVGEYVAACLAGVLELPDALRLMAVRGRLMQSLPADGGMAAIFAPEGSVSPRIARHAARVSIAAVNAPNQTVIAGGTAEIDAICAELTKEGVRSKTLKVSHAFHSPLVDPILDAYEAEVAKVRLSPPRIRLVSNLTGRIAEASEVTTPKYWREHVREAVRFGDGLKAFAALKLDCVIEVGPHPTLLPFVSAALGDAVLGLSSLRRNQPDWEQLLAALGSLFLAGADVNLRALEDGPRRITELPTYPFQRQRYWFVAKPVRARARRNAHPLLGSRLRAATAETVYETAVSTDSPSWLSAHRVLDHVVMPATAYLETLLAAAHDVLRSDLVQVEGVTVKEAMLLAAGGAPRTMQVVCAPSRDGIVAASIHSIADDAEDSAPWTSHVTASLRLGAPASAEPSLEAIRERCTTTKTVEEHYAGFERRGLAFAAEFRTVRALWQGDSEALGEIALAEELVRDVAHYRVHPVLLDGCLQVLDAALSASGEALYLPIGIGRFTLYGNPGARCFGHVVVRGGGEDTRTAHVRVFDTCGKVIAELAEVQLKRASRDAFERMGDRWLEDCLYETTWRPAPLVRLAAVALSPLALAHAAHAKLGELRSSSGIDPYDAFHERFESLCGTYVVHAMRRLGWSPIAGDSVDPDALARKLGVEPRHGQLFARLLAILAEDGWLSRDGDGLRVMRTLAFDAPDHAAVIAKCPAAADEVELTAQLGAKLAEALRGEVDPMELLFGDPSRFERIYRDTPTARFWNGLMAETLATASSGNRGLRILEVGGGTGATTAHVVPRLEGAEYTFTDVGPLFVTRARERFGATHSFMRFQTLDLERAPEAQGLEKHSFDVVIASNVIHATTDLRATLAKIRDLLVPGGLLAMLEVTAPQRWFDLTVGFTEGWWAFRDRDLRSDYATLPRDRWLALLAESGFENATAVPQGSERGVLALQSIFLARSVRPASDWVLFADRGGVMASLATKLRERGDRVTLVHAGASFALNADDATLDLSSRDDVKRLFDGLRALGRTARGVVHAGSLDEADGLRAVTSCLGVAQVLVGDNDPPHLWLVTRGGQQADANETSLAPQSATSWGLSKAIGLEHPELHCVCVDIEEDTAIDALLNELDARDPEREIALRRAGRKVARLTRMTRSRGPTRPSTYRLATTTPGALDGLGLHPLERRAPGRGEIEIAVEATGLNFKDTLNVLGMYPGDPGPLGGECAGTVSAVGPDVTHLRVGDDVLAVAGGSFASHVIARADFVQRRPTTMSAEEGASIPIAFVTAEFCLNHLAKMSKGDRVLIHAAAGGVGMAAVRLAQRAGAEIFATAGAPWKRALLREMGVPHVFDSRSTTFADEIMARTGGKGVDLVLNSLADELIDASFRALAHGGRFVEMGKRGIKTPEWVAAQGRDLTYFIVDWGETAEQDPALITNMLARLMADFGRSDALALTPLPRHVFPLDEATRAFRFMAQARHAGKVVVRHGEAAAANVRHDGTYLVTGGLAGIGLDVARWLAARGAGKIALVSRRGVTDAARPILEELRRQGSAVVAEAIDITDEAAVRGLLDRLRKEGLPIRGVIHGAGILENAALLRQDATSFAHVFAPKVRGALLLDTLTRTDPLDSFVLFSSVAAVLGARGQANHSAANAFLDVLARQRRAIGLPGLSIDWGAWTETGAAADPEVTARLAAQGLGMLKPAQAIAAMELLLAGSSPQAAVLPIDWQRYLQTRPASPFFSELAGKAVAPGAAPMNATKARAVDLQKDLAAVPQGRWRPMVTSFVRERALKTLGLDPARAIDPRTPLGDLGLDSLLAVELRNTLSGALGQSLPATLLFDYPTIEKLSEHILSSVLGVSDDAPAPVEEPTTVEAKKGESIVESIEELSDEEVERQLAARGARVGSDSGRDEDVR